MNCEEAVWHQVRVRVEGDEIRLSVDGRAFEPVRDATFTGPGRVGLMEFRGAHFRNLAVRGVPEEAPRWKADIKPGATGSRFIAPVAGKECPP